MLSLSCAFISLQKRQSNNDKEWINKKGTSSEKLQNTSAAVSEVTNESFNNINPSLVLDIVIESTYAM